MTSFADVTRAHFPALLSGFVFADNAGGSQCTELVAKRIFDYLINTNAQLGADYSVSAESTRRVSAGIAAAVELFNAASPDEIVFGASSTINLENLARSIEGDVLNDEEIVVTGEHEGFRYLISFCMFSGMTLGLSSKCRPVEETCCAQGPYLKALAPPHH